MTDKNQRLPYGISEYIHEHFTEDFLFEVKNIREAKDHTYYTIEVSKDNYIHRLRFNENGKLVKEDADEAFPADIHDEPGFGDIPE